MPKDFISDSGNEYKREILDSHSVELKDNNPFKKMVHYDEVFSRVNSALNALVASSAEPLINDIDEQTDRIITRDILEPLDDIIDESIELHKLLPKFLLPFFDHDADTFKRNVIGICKKCISPDLFQLSNGVIGKNSRRDVVNDVMKNWRSILKNWEAYRLVMQDLFLRSDSKENGYVKPEDKEMDKGIKVKRLLAALEWLMTEDFRLAGAGNKIDHVSYIPDKGTIENLEVNVPHGFIFNFLQNCAANAARFGIRNQDDFKLRLVISYDAEKGEVSFSLSDNGCGMTDEERKNIYVNGVSHHKSTGGKGIGLANAKERAASFGGVISETSKNNKDFSNKDFVTNFTMLVKAIS